MLAAVVVVLMTAAGPTRTFATSTPQTLSDEQRRVLCARAVEEVKAARAHIDALEAREATLRAELAAQKEKDALQTEEAASLRRELALVVADKEKAEEQLANSERAVAVLTEDRERIKQERDRWRGRTITWTVVGAIAGGVLVYVLTRDRDPIVIAP